MRAEWVKHEEWRRNEIDERIANWGNWKKIEHEEDE